MIVRKESHVGQRGGMGVCGAVSLLFTMQGSIVPAIMPAIIFAAFWGALINLIHEQIGDVGAYLFTPFTALGVAISLFLGFRNNAAYARWWEARKLWGQLLITTRNFERLLLVVDKEASPPPGPAVDKPKGLHQSVLNGFGGEERSARAVAGPGFRRTIMKLVLAHLHALRSQLRPQDVTAAADCDRCLTDEQRLAVSGMCNKADALLRLVSLEVGKMYRDGIVDSITMVAITQQLDSMGYVQGGCERIQSTPLPFPYMLLVHRSVYLYILFSPFALVGDMGYFTSLFMAIVAYTFLGLDELARQLAVPFANEEQCLALGAICRTIERSVTDSLGDKRPDALTPVRHRLM